MRVSTLVTMLTAALALAACDREQEAADMPMAGEDMPMSSDDMPMAPGDMPMMEGGETERTAGGEGEVTAIDPKAGTITIKHGPVPAMDWPAMTMAFEASEAHRQQVAVGDQVAFTFRMAKDGSEITSITKK